MQIDLDNSPVLFTSFLDQWFALGTPNSLENSHFNEYWILVVAECGHGHGHKPKHDFFFFDGMDDDEESARELCNMRTLPSISLMSRTMRRSTLLKF